VINLKTRNLLKSKLSFIFIFTVAFTFSIGLCSGTGSKVLAADDKISESTAKTINVTGNGEINATPDIAYVSLGVITEKNAVSEAQNENSNTMNKIIDGVKKQGIQSEDIKTINYSISPKYNYDNKTGNNTLVGYTVLNTLSVTVKDITKVGTIIDSAVANGANNSNGVSFGVSDYQKYYNMALKNAISNAAATAQVIASSIGVTISTPIKITEDSSSIPNQYPVYFDGADKNSTVGQSSMSVETGTYKIKASVSLVYQY
jgi:uncharacterized protein YggE